jgi:glycosyltransferase involved in cell wall biosynthesis
MGYSPPLFCAFVLNAALAYIAFSLDNVNAHVHSCRLESRLTSYGGNPLRILFDARMVRYRRAGIGQYAINLLRAMSRLPEPGEESRVGILQMRSDPVPIVDDARFRRVPMWTPPHNRFEQAALSAELLAAGLATRAQLIHCPDFVPPRFRLMRAIVNVHDLAFLKFPGTTLLTDESKRYYAQVPWAAHNAEALITLSQSARDDMVQLLRVNPNKIAVIPAAAGEDFKPPSDLPGAQKAAATKYALPMPDEGGYILFVSTIEPRKNLPTLLEAYSLLRDHARVRPLPALAVVGREGWLFEEVHSRIKELGLKDMVRLLGEVPGADLVALYQGARAFAMPSLYEGFGLPALEALACGVPVLASNAGSLPEVVGEAGVLLDPHDVDGWTDALERVLVDEIEAQRLRLAGPKQAASFSWERAARQTWGLYARVA